MTDLCSMSCRDASYFYLASFSRICQLLTLRWRESHSRHKVTDTQSVLQSVSFVPRDLSVPSNLLWSLFWEEHSQPKSWLILSIFIWTNLGVEIWLCLLLDKKCRMELWTLFKIDFDSVIQTGQGILIDDSDPEPKQILSWGSYIRSLADVHMQRPLLLSMLWLEQACCRLAMALPNHV